MEEEAWVELSIYTDEQCSLWFCLRRKVEEHFGYCTANHLALSDHYGDFPIPTHMSNMFTVHQFETHLLVKICNLLTNEHAPSPGIPDLTLNENVISHNPWQLPDLFDTNLTLREQVRLWLFVAVFTPHPEIYRPSRGSVLRAGEIVRTRFSVRDEAPMGSNWLLYRYTVLNIGQSALYCLKYRPPAIPHPYL